MEEHQPHIKRTVLFDNESSPLSCRNLGSSGPKLHRLVIHPFLGLRTELAWLVCVSAKDHQGSENRIVQKRSLTFKKMFQFETDLLEYSQYTIEKCNAM
jgi:hypothetical protein